jgi:putative FmdB family regulatory protein
MPVYAYRCENCGVQFERHQTFDEAPLKTCPECRKKTLRKVIGPTRVIFKGSGFYATDHKSASGGAATKPEKAAKKEEAKPAGQESKPAPAASSDSAE